MLHNQVIQNLMQAQQVQAQAQSQAQSAGSGNPFQFTNGSKTLPTAHSDKAAQTASYFTGNQTARQQDAKSGPLADLQNAVAAYQLYFRIIRGEATEGTRRLKEMKNLLKKAGLLHADDDDLDEDGDNLEQELHTIRDDRNRPIYDILDWFGEPRHSDEPRYL